jgi:dTDP-4-dehydrorhamnose reductase
MKVLVTGGRGQLGRALVRRGAARGDEILALGRDELDLCDARLAAHIAALAPALVINAAAYTAVDRAEAEAARAFAVNASGAERVAQACAAQHRALLHISTDYVFDGSSPRAYHEDDPVAPLGVYGASKAAGERAVIACGGTVVRTSWLFGEGGPSFVHTMLRLAAERPVVRVVADQHGCPTWADDLADALLALGRHATRATCYHACGDGPTTWHGFAEAIVAEARQHRALVCQRIDAINTAAYLTPARRPARAVLNTARLGALGLALPSWRAGLARVVAQGLSAG